MILYKISSVADTNKLLLIYAWLYVDFVYNNNMLVVVCNPASISNNIKRLSFNCSNKGTAICQKGNKISQTTK
jgi:hypothetical protein